SEEKPLLDWAVEPDGSLNDSEAEDLLHAVDPNKVFPRGPPGLPVDPPSESEESLSEDPSSPVTMVTTQVDPAAVYQVVYDLGALASVKPEPGLENVISIELDHWSSKVLVSDSCVVSELPVFPAAHAAPPSPDGHLLLDDLQLTEEEQKLLSQEGVSLPTNLPLTK
ncbi:unnamed protein product, partial [Tetraodon nigroviridis]